MDYFDFLFHIQGKIHQCYIGYILENACVAVFASQEVEPQK